MSFSVVALGVGDAFSRRFYSTAFLLESAGRKLLIDCPHPIHKMLYEAEFFLGQPERFDDIPAVILTHYHADHCSGLEMFSYHRTRIAGREPARLLAHPEVLQDLWEKRLALSMGGTLGDRRLEDFFEPVELHDDRETTCGTFSIRCRRTKHSVPTFALRITASGHTLSYSSDTSFDPALIRWLSEDASMIIHETNIPPHTRYADLRELPPEIRSRMYLVHYPDDFPSQDPQIPCLEQGREYLIGENSR